MEIAARLVPGRLENRGEAPTPPALERDRAVSVTATYLLSEDGRKASLLAGGDGRAVQQVIFPVPVSRLHLVAVDGNGVARLKLRPRFELDANQRVVRKDHLPTYDAPPTIDELLFSPPRGTAFCASGITTFWQIRPAFFQRLRERIIVNALVA